MEQNKTCLRDACTNEPRTRGLCVSDYGVAKKMVNAKQTTWEELLVQGKILPSGGMKILKSQAWLLDFKNKK